MESTKNFTRAELQCKCGCGQMKIPADFLIKLQELRDLCGFPLPVNSGYRCPTHDKNVGGLGNGPHTIAAVDLGVYGAQAVKVLEHALKLRFTGIGVSQKGSISSRFLHLDALPADALIQRPRPFIWTY